MARHAGIKRIRHIASSIGEDFTKSGPSTASVMATLLRNGRWADIDEKKQHDHLVVFLPTTKQDKSSKKNSPSPQTLSSLYPPPPPPPSSRLHSKPNSLFQYTESSRLSARRAPLGLSCRLRYNHYTRDSFSLQPPSPAVPYTHRPDDFMFLADLLDYYKKVSLFISLFSLPPSLSFLLHP